MGPAAGSEPAVCRTLVSVAARTKLSVQKKKKKSTPLGIIAGASVPRGSPGFMVCIGQTLVSVAARTKVSVPYSHAADASHVNLITQTEADTCKLLIGPNDLPDMSVMVTIREIVKDMAHAGCAMNMG